MPSEPSGDILRQLRTLYDGGVAAGLTDAQLLERFVGETGEAAEFAFAVLVERHGPMVLRVCRAALRDEHDAQDAFQAVFLVLVRKAGSLWVRGTLGPWLHAVTQRVTAGIRDESGRRRVHESSYANINGQRAGKTTSADDLGPLLHEEVGRLPDRYRVPVVLCDLEGLTHEEAARQLGWPVGTVKSRQARGRERLRGQLTRRGLNPTAGAAIGAAFTAEAASTAELPRALAEATVRAATGSPTAGAVPASVIAVTEGVLRSTAMNRMTAIAAGLLLGGLATAGAVVIAQQGERPEGETRVTSTEVRKTEGLKIPRVDAYKARPDGGMVYQKAVRRPRADAQKGPREVVPKEIPVRVSGRAIDTAGRAVAGATVYLFSDKFLSRIVATTNTDRDGAYLFDGIDVPVDDGTFNGVKLPNHSPSVWVQVVATAPGYGVSWQQPKSMYAVEDVDPDDIQGRLPLGTTPVMDLTFRPADALRGRIVDERDRPVKGIELTIHDAELLDADGLETNRALRAAWSALPGGTGRAVTDTDGRFRIDGLPSEACFWVWLKDPAYPNSNNALYAATIETPVAEHRQPRLHNGRMPHKVHSGDIALTVATPRRLLVRVVASDTGQPLAGIHLGSGDSELATGVHSYGTSDKDGKVTLELPPGQYRSIYGDPPITTHYIRTYQRPLTIAAEPAEQPYEFRMNAGCELLVHAVDSASGKGIPDALFWLVPADGAGERKQIKASTFGGAFSYTNDDGQMRAVLTPEPGKTYVLTFAGIRLPNYPEYFFGRPEEQPRFDVAPARSEPFVLEPGKTVRVELKMSRESK